MKRVRIAVGILLLLMSMAFFAHLFSDKMITKATQLLDKASDYVQKEEYQRAKQYVNQVYQLVDENEKWLSMFCNQEKIISLEINVKALAAYATQANIGDFLYEIQRCKEELRILKRFLGMRI